MPSKNIKNAKNEKKLRMPSKKAIELSVNFLVVLIIAIAIFSGAIALTYKLFSKVKTGTEQLDEAQKQELQRLLAGGSRVAVPINTVEIRSGKTASVAVGILNNIGYNTKFRTTAVVNAAFKQSTVNIPGPSQYIEFIFVPERPINNNDQFFFPIAIKVKNSAPVGTYIVDIKVYYRDSSGQEREYDTLKKDYL